MKKSASATKRQEQLRQLDQEFLNRGYSSLAGVDEAGRGPLAGPVVASAVVVRDFSFTSTVNDSKKLSAKAREAAFEEIHEKCSVGVAIVGHEVIDEVNVLRAALRAMSEAVRSLGAMPGCLLIDGNRVPRDLKVMRYPLIGGDGRSFSVACASIVAKVTRDRIMDRYEDEYPGYGFAKHKGYGTPEHLKALLEKGPCPIHRKTFEPIKSMAGVA